MNIDLFYNLSKQFVLLLYFVLFGSVAQTIESSNDSNFIIIASDEYCPYTCIAGRGFDGFSVELIQQALKLKGYKTEYLNATFKRVKREVTKDNWQILPVTVKGESPSLILSKESVAHLHGVFVIRKGDKWKYDGIKSLKARRIGLVKGHLYKPDLMAFASNPKNADKIIYIGSINASATLIDMLSLDRIDTFTADENIIRYIAKNKGIYNKIKFVGKSRDSVNYNGIAPNRVQLAADLDDGVKQIKQTVIFQQLIKKYDITGW